MIFLLVGIFMCTQICALHRQDPAALAISSYESLSGHNLMQEQVPRLPVVERDADVIGVCKTSLSCANYQNNPDALVLHNVVLDRPFLLGTISDVKTLQVDDSSQIASEQELITLIRNLHTQDHAS